MDPSQSDLEAIRRLIAELTTRVYRIERKLELGAQSPASVPARPESAIPIRPTSDVGLPKPPYSVVPAPSIPPRQVKLTPSRIDSDLESRIGSQWLNRVGIAALLIGVSYFLKFAFENNWIGPAGRIVVGLVSGVALVAWSERFRTRGYTTFSYSLKAIGIGTLYLSAWASFQIYSLVPSGIAFMTMLTVTAATGALALAQDAEMLAAFALVGGFATPLLLSSGRDREIALFVYVAIFDIATLVLLYFRPWRRLLILSFVGTLLLYIDWYSTFYVADERNTTLAFATLFFAVFAIAPRITLQPRGQVAGWAWIPAALTLVNAVAYFLQVYAIVGEVDKTSMAWSSLGLAAVYVWLSRRVHARNLEPDVSRTLQLLHIAVAVGLLTIAIPIGLNAHWITIGWFVESAALLWVAQRIKSDFLNAFALVALVLGVVRLLLFDNFESGQLIVNMRMGTYSVAVAVLGLVAWYASRREDEAAKRIATLALIALNLLALTALTREIFDYFALQMRPYLSSPVNRWRGSWSDLHRLRTERDFTYSALWMGYGAMLMIVGFLRRSASIRWQALVLIAFTIGKVSVYDLSELDRGYRIVSFIVLGVLLLAISFVYQRDWLKLSAKSTVSADAERSSQHAN